MKKLFAITIFLAILLSACSGRGGVKQIASSPRLTPIARYPTIVYQGFMELQVTDVDAAVERAARLAENNRGYFSAVQSWYVDGRKVTSIELAVPTTSFDRLRGSLYQLGLLVNETVSSLPADPPRDLPAPYSSITVQLRPADRAWPVPPPPVDPPSGWNPTRTFDRAFGVFVSIFGFLADGIIWVVVVAGPFILIGLLAWLLIRRLRRV